MATAKECKDDVQACRGGGLGVVRTLDARFELPPGLANATPVSKLGGSGDLSFISLNVWNQFLNDFGIIDKKSKFLKQSDLDTLFITIDSAASRVQQQSGVPFA